METRFLKNQKTLNTVELEITKTKKKLSRIHQDIQKLEGEIAILEEQQVVVKNFQQIEEKERLASSKKKHKTPEKILEEILGFEDLKRFQKENFLKPNIV
jgi:hypothetical protein